MSKFLSYFQLSPILLCINCGFGFNLPDSINNFIPNHTEKTEDKEIEGQLVLDAEDVFKEDSDLFGSKIIPHSVCKELITKIKSESGCSEYIASVETKDPDCFAQLPLYISQYAECKGTVGLIDINVAAQGENISIYSILEPYYSADLLSSVKVTYVDKFLLEFDELKEKQNQYDDKKEIAGMTFNNNIFINKKFKDNIPLYFHEMVHVVQYRDFGTLQAFLETYVEFSLIYQYRQIPHEWIAFELEKRFIQKNINSNVEDSIKTFLIDNKILE